MSAHHQYLTRTNAAPLTEDLFGDRIVRLLYSHARENAPVLFRALTGKRVSKLLGWANFDSPLAASLLGNQRFLARNGVDLSECLDAPRNFRTPRDVFERKIRYWDCRPLPLEETVVVSPADSRVLIGSFDRASGVHVKEKFFHYDELLGVDRPRWLKTFFGGDFAVFRLTPDKYHYNHAPVSGRILDVYGLGDRYHSCNPAAVVEVVTPYSKNKRYVTVIDTDVPGGSQVGRVAMIEVVALMIGEIVQAYSDVRYDDPRPVEPGMFVRRGQPKSLYRPGSSTDVLLFEPGRVRFAPDLLRNLSDRRAHSRFTSAFGQPLTETDVAVRSAIAQAVPREPAASC